MAGNFFGLGQSPKLSGRGAARGSVTETLRATSAYVFAFVFLTTRLKKFFLANPRIVKNNIQNN